MAIVFDSDAGTITGISVGGLPDGVVDAGTLATDSVTAAKIAANSVDSTELVDGAVDDSHMASISGRKNMVINGAMRVAQRGTSETGVTSLGYKQAPDRFKINYESAGTWTVSQSTEAPEGFSNSYKFDCTTADASLSADDYLRLDQKIEAQDLQHLKYGTANAESITVSFWVRSAKTGTYTVELQHGENPSTFRYAGLQYTINSANTWEKKALTFSGQTANAINNDSGTGLEIHWYLAVGSAYTSGGYTAGTFRESNGTSTRCSGQTANLADSTSNDWHITGVQLELGSTATDFEHRSYGEELALCQRYYQKMQSSMGGQGFGAGFAYSSTALFTQVFFPTSMRAAPSKTYSSLSDFRILYGTGTKTATDHETQVGTYGGRLGWTTSGLTAGDGIFFDATNTTAYIAFDAEL